MEAVRVVGSIAGVKEAGNISELMSFAKTA